VTVDAPVEEVWAVLTALESWPSWNPGVGSMEVRGSLAAGTEFRWVAGGMRIHSRIETIEAPRRIVWSGRTMGIRAVHLWELAPAGTATRVHTEEAFLGLIVRLFAGRMKRELEAALAQGLDALKTEAERRRVGART
jgi:hypothetical protein